MTEETREAGARLQRRMMGDHENTTHSGSEDPAEFVANFVQEHIFGELWQRDVIDLRTRSLCTIAAIVACRGSEDALKNHVRGALANGATREQILEVVVHTAVYSGFPVLPSAMRASQEAIEDCEV